MKRFLFTMALLLALGAGVWIGTRVRGPSPYRSERAAMDLQMARALLPFQVAFRVLLGGVMLFTLGGVGWGVVRWINRKADTIYPDRSGLYPIREGRVGRAKVFHDPNRTLTGTTIYAASKEGIKVQHPMPPGQEAAQQRVTGQAQVAQAVRAAVSGVASFPPPVSAFDSTAERVSRPLPEVEEMPYEVSHIERLLLQDGG